MLRTDPKNRAVTTKAKAKVNHPGVRDTSKLLASQGRERVSFATSLDILNRIARRGKAPRDMGRHSPNHSGTHIDVVHSPLPQHGPRELMSVLVCYTSTY